MRPSTAKAGLFCTRRCDAQRKEAVLDWFAGRPFPWPGKSNYPFGYGSQEPGDRSQQEPAPLANPATRYGWTPFDRAHVTQQLPQTRCCTLALPSSRPVPTVQTHDCTVPRVSVPGAPSSVPNAFPPSGDTDRTGGSSPSFPSSSMLSNADGEKGGGESKRNNGQLGWSA